METEIQNTSGLKAESIVPEEVKNRFNWAAFLLTWIWGFDNKVYNTLFILPLSIIRLYVRITLRTSEVSNNTFSNPLFVISCILWIIFLGIRIWFGIKGNEWAWKNKKFESIEKFHSYQKKLIIIGIFLFAL